MVFNRKRPAYQTVQDAGLFTADGLGGAQMPQGAKFLSDEWRAIHCKKQRGWASRSGSHTNITLKKDAALLPSGLLGPVKVRQSH